MPFVRGERAFRCLLLSFSNRNAVSSVLSVSSEFHARIHTLLQTMEHRDVARLKSAAVTGKIMNELDLRKDRPAQGLLRLYLFIFHPSTRSIFSCPNGWYKFSYKWLLSDNVTASSARQKGNLATTRERFANFSALCLLIVEQSPILRSGTGLLITRLSATNECKAA